MTDRHAQRDTYQRLAGELAAAARVREQECAAARQTHTEGRAALTTRVAQAQQGADRAQERLAASVAAMAATDARAAGYLAELTSRSSTSRSSTARSAAARSTEARWAAARAGIAKWEAAQSGTSGRAHGVPNGQKKPATARSPADLLDRVAACLAAMGREPPVMALPAGFLWLVPALGAIIAAVVAGLARVMSHAAGDGHLAVDALGEVLVFLAPFAGIPVLFWIIRYRYGGRPDAGAIGLAALGGMIACCAIVVGLG